MRYKQNVELVIKISKEKYDIIKSDLYCTFPAEMKEWGLDAIRNGTPLQEGHGDLFDENEFEKRVAIMTKSMDLGYGEIMDIIDEISTTIKAERE